MTESQLNIVMQAKDQATRDLQKMQGLLGGVAKQAASFGIALVGVQAAGGAFNMAKNAVVGFNARMEQSKIGWSTMLKSGAAAEVMLKDLQRFAATTPFEFPDLERASKRLLAMGFAARDIIPLMTSVGDAASALGMSSEGIDRITLALGQMRAKAKVSGEEMLQMTETGIPAWEILATAVGKPIPEVMKLATEGKIASDVFIQAFQKFSQQNWGGMMQKQSRTFLGAISTIKDSLAMAAGTAFKPIFDRISDLGQRIAEFVQTKDFEEWANTVANLTERALSDIGAAVGRFQDDIAEMSESTKGKILFIAGLLVAGGPLVKAITVSIKAVGYLGAAWKLLPRVVSGSVVAIGAALLIFHEQIGNFLSEWGKGLAIIGRGWGRLFPGSRMGKDFEAWGESVNQFGKNLATMQLTLESVGDAVTDTLDPAFEGLTKTVMGLGDMDMLKGAVAAVEEWAQSASGAKDDGLELAMAGDKARIALNSAGKTGKEAGNQIGDGLDKAKKAAKELGVSVSEIIPALVSLHPATAAAAAQVQLWERRISDVTLAIQANQDQVKAAQAEYGRMSDQLSDLNRQLSETKSRLSDLSRPRLAGMGDIETQINAVQDALKRMDLADTLGQPFQEILAQYPLLTKGAMQYLSTLPLTREGLEAALKQLQALEGVKYDEQLRLLGQAAQDASQEMTFSGALQAIQDTKGRIGELTGAISAQEAAMRSQQNAINSIQAASEALNRTLAAYQEQLKAAQVNQQAVTQALQMAFQWLLVDREKFTELGAEGERVAGVMDEKTRALLLAITGAAEDTTGTSAVALAAMVTAYQRDMAVALSEIGKVQGALGAIPRDITTVHTTYHQDVFLPSRGPTGGEQVTVPAFQHGGIVRGPTLALIGESGPEAVVPLRQQGSMPMGVTINLYVSGNTLLGDDQTTAERLARIIKPKLDSLVRLGA